MAWSEWKVFSSYSNVMYVSDAGNNVSTSVSLTVPDNVTSGMLMFTKNAYTGFDADLVVSIPSDVEYEVLMENQTTELTGYATNYAQVQIIKASNISGKTFTVTTNQGYVRGFIWLFY